jgi:hypothetical protein
MEAVKQLAGWACPTRLYRFRLTGVSGDSDKIGEV